MNCYCPHCGRPIEYYFNYCCWCGVSFNHVTNQTEQEKEWIIYKHDRTSQIYYS